MRCYPISYTRNDRRLALSLIECLVVTGITCGLLVLLTFVMTGSRCGPPGNRMVCGSNLKGIGTSMKIYANDNREQWATPPFNKSAIGQIKYSVPVGWGRGLPESPSRNQSSLDGPAGTRELSVTRAMWILVRSGDMTVDQFICPTSGDVPDPTSDIDFYYDFAGYNNISYGFQVPYGSAGTRAREGHDNRMILAADKGPFYLSSISPNWLSIPEGTLPAPDSNKSGREPFNSPNHVKSGVRTGQNCLYFDGHVSFNRSPNVGIGGDNIYTVATDWNRIESWWNGEIPGLNSTPPLNALVDPNPDVRRSDSVIFP